MSSNKIFDSIITRFQTHDKIAIISHVKPDGDTLGSALALCHYLQQLKNVSVCQVFCDDELPEKYGFLKDYHTIKRDFNADDYSLIVCVDSSDLNRIGSFRSSVAKHNNVINIDHHISNDMFGDAVLVDDKSSSTCEIILALLEYAGAQITRDIAECIYCGLSSDTGNFSHSNTNTDSFLHAAKLTDIIGDISYINQKIYKEMPVCRLRLVSAATSRIKLFCEDKAALLYVTQADLQKYCCNAYQTEGIVDYAINLKGVEVGVMILQSSQNGFKVSFRSKNIDVCKIAADFGGGGHIHASGCMLYGDLDTVIDKIIKTVEFYAG